jgi:hypothetical protein
MLCGVGEAVAVNVGVPANGVFVGDGPADIVPTKDMTLLAGRLNVKLFPDTATADCCTRLLDASVIHGTAEDVDIPLRLNVVLCAEELLFTHTMTYLLRFVSI